MQTSVPATGQSRAFAGLIADSSELVDVVSAWSEEASAEMPFGIGLAQGTAAQGALIPSGAGDKLKGLLAHSYAHAPGGAAGFGDMGSTGIIAGGRLRCLRHGRIWVVLDASVASIAPFVDRGWCRHTTDGGANTVPGRWNKADLGGGKQLDATKQVLFVSDVVTAPDGTKIAEVEVNFTAAP